MKKLLLLLLSTMTVCSYADEAPKMMMPMPTMMYMDFGLGMGNASHWTDNSAMAINVMTMGFYVKPNLGIELGMDMLPNGTYDGSDAMINSFHVAAKRLLPLSQSFNLYGKLGLGINAGQGTETSDSMMQGMNMQDMQMIMPVDVGPYYGLGVQFDLSEKFALYLEDSGVIAVSHTSSNSFGNTNITTMGLEVRM